MSHRPSPGPLPLQALERRAVAATIRTLVVSLATLILSGWALLLVRDHLGIYSVGLLWASTLTTIVVVALTTLGSWNRAWSALERIDVGAHRWALSQAARNDQAKAYLDRLYLMGRPLLQEDVWHLEAMRHRRESEYNGALTALKRPAKRAV